MIASCGSCPWEIDVAGDHAAHRALSIHRQRRHGDTPRADPHIEQLAHVSWQQAFLTAVAALPAGQELTTADLHALVPPPPHHNAWGGATSAAAHLGLIREVATQKSQLATTKSSLVRRWVRTEAKARTA